MVMRSKTLAPFALLSVGCSTLLGGLEEGTARDGGAAAASSEPSDAASGACPGLRGARHRIPFTVHHTGAPVRSFQVLLTPRLADHIAVGRMRADARDLRATLGDGTTTAAHWVESLGDGDLARVWVRVDLAYGDTNGFLYFDGEHAFDAASMTDTFVAGVLDDTGFTRDDSWHRLHDRAPDEPPASSTNEWSVSVADGAATLRLVRNANLNGSMAGICQTAYFPGGSSYVIGFDGDVTIADNGQAYVWLDGLRGTWLWTSSTVGRHRAETKPILAGTNTICFAVSVGDGPNGQGAEATYSKVHVRRVADVDPVVTLRDAEPAPCP